MRETSARQVLKHIPFGMLYAITILMLMNLTGINDELVIRTAISTLREHGHLIFCTEDGKFYQPADASELEEYRQRRPAELRAMLAFRNMHHYGFHKEQRDMNHEREET